MRPPLLGWPKQRGVAIHGVVLNKWEKHHELNNETITELFHIEKI